MNSGGNIGSSGLLIIFLNSCTTDGSSIIVIEFALVIALRCPTKCVTISNIDSSSNVSSGGSELV
jgi:hypothetical protein